MKKMRMTVCLLIALQCLGVTGCGERTTAPGKDAADNQNVQETTVPLTEPMEAKLKTVTLGNIHSAALMDDGDLYMWGSNTNGQLGNGSSESLSRPRKIMEQIESVSLGFAASAAITTNGELYVWGSNSSGKLGDGSLIDSSTPVKIQLDDVVAVELGGNHSAAITANGSLYMWGDNYWGQLGNGNAGGEQIDYDPAFDSSVPIKIMDQVKAVNLGLNNSAAITEDGSLYVWGYGEYGDLGIGIKGSSAVPVKILDGVVSVSMGRRIGMAITEDGSLYTWGSEGASLGKEGIENQLVPVKIMDGVTAVSAFDSHMAILTEDGSMYTWGTNYHGGLGNGTEKSSSTPVKILDDVISISVGEDHSAAITAEGDLYTWGTGKQKLGNGDEESSESVVLTPTKISVPKYN